MRLRYLALCAMSLGAAASSTSLPQRIHPVDAFTAARARLAENHRRLRKGERVARAAAKSAAIPSGPLQVRFPDPRLDAYDVLHYALDLKIDPWNYNRRIQGSVEVTLTPTGPKLYELVLQLEDHMSATAVTRIGGGAELFDQANDQIVVELAQPLRAGEVATLRIDYEGTPLVSGFGAFDVYWDRAEPVVWTLSEPEGAHYWWPCKDRPDDKASAEISVTMDDLFVVGSNGLLLSVDDNGDGTATHNWAIDYAIPSYLVSVTATDFVLIEDSYDLLSGGTLPLTYYTWPESEEPARIDLQALPGMLRTFEEEWGDYPYATEKYGHAEFPWGGGMEHATLTSYGTYFYTGDHYFDWIMAHELAHQWWGDMVTCATWDDIWLNEGFATWGEAIWTEGAGGESAYLSYMQMLAADSFDGPIYAPDYTFNNTVYDKGAWVLHMLRGIVGRETVMAILRQWGSDYAYEAATTADFTALAAAVAGEDLDWFFDPWLYQPGRPDYQYSVDLTPIPGDSTRVDLQITQVQNGVNPYRMPIAVRLARSGQGDVFATLDNSQTSEAFELRIEGTVTAVEMDPDGYILADFREM